ncbi:MAG TPA: Ig-like domain-containing protein, partial [Vicinamibacterales bacterium]|nr:Ig-like domain-containing protein [Vicinamibacterales bacterium]
PASLRGPPGLRLTGVSGAPVPGRVDVILGNTVAVFTPDAALAPDTTYRVQAPPARDLAGNVQAAGLDYTFATTDRTPPVVTALTVSNAGLVVENGIATVVAEVGAQHDVLFVDFFLNDAFAATVRAPFAFSFQAVPALGGPGAQIRVSAVPTDTSGNRGAPATALVTVTPDLPPSATIVSPPAGASFRNGEPVKVVVQLADDLGVRQVGFRADTGRPQDAAARAIDPPSPSRTETFTFSIPTDAAPGATIAVRASAIDTKGQAVEAPPVTITVLDAVAPSVGITGATTGDRVLPGQQTTVVVSAQDAGGVASVTFRATGAAASTQTRTIDPPQPSVVTTFTVTVPSSATATQTLRLDATAVDRAGNVGAAAQVVLPVADRSAPTVTLQTESGRLEIVRGRSFTVIAAAQDDLAVTQIELTGSGAFAVSETRQLSPPLASGQVSFTVAVPDTAQPGAILELRARAFDFAGNASAPASLALVVQALPEVVFPPSLLLVAGRSAEVTVGLSEPAPAGGTDVVFRIDPNIATAPASVRFAEGESSKTITVFGVAGGTTFLDGLIAGVERGRMTVAVQGGIVSGVVRDQALAPVAGAQVTITSVFPPLTAETDGDGRYVFQGVVSTTVTLKVLKDIDQTTRLLGFASGSMNRPNGFVELNVVLVEAGVIQGTVRLQDGQTPAGPDVRVDLFEARNPFTPIATDFTDANSAFEFPLVALGEYVVEASGPGGNRGRERLTLTTSGEERTVLVVYLGRGVVRGTVVDALGARVGTATVTLWSSSIFGPAPPVSRPVQSDGSFRFDDVFVGSFTLQARDPATNQAATFQGSIAQHGQEIERELRLSSYGGLQGTVYRGSGTDRTIVAGARVSVHGVVTTTDETGQYSFDFLPLGPFTVSVRHESSRGLGLESGTLTQPGVVETKDVTLFGQGTLAVKVEDAGGNAVEGAALTVLPDNGQVRDTIFATTGAGGLVVVEHVLAGNVLVMARFGPLVGQTTVTLAANEAKSIVVRLQPSASIAGTVYEPDGITPATGGTVGVDFSSTRAPIGPDGRYRLDGLLLTPPGYTLTAFDAQGRARAKVKQPIVLSVNAQVATADMTFVGLGTVRGQVVNPLAPDGSGGADLTVTVRSLHPDFGRTYSARTNAAGFYEVEGVIAGDVTASVVHPALRLRGEGVGRIEGHGAVATINLTLQNNLIDLPATRWDANNARFDIQRDASVRAGGSAVFEASATASGASRLEIVRGGTAHAFAGASVGTFEDGGREIAVGQDDLAGLSVTRKVFVPRAGYFARYLELVTNPTEAPVTVDLRLLTHLGASSAGSPQVVATSSGDAALDTSDPATADRWVVVDDGSDQPGFSLPAVAAVFGGPGAAAAASDAAFLPQPSGSGRQVGWRWANLTIGPGETIALLHFVVQQAVRSAAQASAERLAQLPAEALAGLSAEEIAAIRNFAVPADGSSSLPATPALDGQVTGRVLAADGRTPIAGATVRFRSANPLFPLVLQATAAGDGSFSFVGTLTDTGTSRAVPLDGFTLEATGPVSIGSPAIPGTFAAGAAVAEQNVVFSNTGLVRGLVRLNSVPAGGISVSATAPGVFSTGRSSAADGTFEFLVLPPATWTISASIVHAGATRTASRVVPLAAGQVADVQLDLDTVAPQVTIASPAAGAAVDPRSPLAVTVEAGDAGGLVEIAFSASGVATASETRAIAPPAASRSEIFTVPFTAPLPIGGSLTLTVTAKDAAGNQATATRTVAVLDVVPPEVVFIAPADGATDVDPNTAIVVQFSEPVSRASVSDATLRLARGGTA